MDLGTAVAGLGLGGRGVWVRGADPRHPLGLGQGRVHEGLIVVAGRCHLLSFVHAPAGEGTEPSRELVGEGREVIVRGRGQGDESERGAFARPRDWIRRGHEETIGQEAVEMGVGIQSAPESLKERHGTGLAAANPERPAATPVPGQQGSQVDPEHLAKELPVHSQGQTKGPGEGQDPLAVRGRGKHAVDQVRRGVGHAPRPAGGAEPALARKGHKTLEAAVGAPEPGEASRKLPAGEVPWKLPLHEGRVASPRLGALAAFVEEGLQVLLDHLVQDRLLRFAATVPFGQRPRRGTGLALVDDGRQGRGLRSWSGRSRWVHGQGPLQPGCPGAGDA